MLDESRLYKSDLSALGAPENLPSKKIKLKQIMLYLTIAKYKLRNFELFF